MAEREILMHLFGDEFAPIRYSYHATLSLWREREKNR